MHGNLAGQLLWMGGAMIAAAIFGAQAKKLKQPKVLGALLGGILISIFFTKTDIIHAIREGHGAELITGFSEIAAMFLLFKAGLEGNLHSIMQDAKKGWKVALIGVVAPIAGGFAYTFYATDVSWTVALFQGGVFAATSVGITAAVLGELGVLKEKYSRTIISAAVIDDVIGLLVLSLGQALNLSGNLDVRSIILDIGTALLFVLIIPLLGHFFAGTILKRLHFADPEAREAIVIGWMLIYGAGALWAGLAAIVGAYFAGVALEEIYFTEHEEDKRERLVEHDIDSFITAFAPIFFIYAGCLIDPIVFLDLKVLFHGLAFTAIAIIGKILAGIAVKKGRRLLVGVGMSPRGEVGIIFATVGLQCGILTPELFGASMIMVLLTTVFTPSALNYLIKKQNNTT